MEPLIHSLRAQWTLQYLWCPISSSGYASLNPLLICCSSFTSLHLDHAVNPGSPCGNIMVCMKPNNPNLLTSPSPLTTHCKTQKFSKHNLYPSTSQWWHVTVHLFHCTSNISSFQGPYNYCIPPTAPLIGLPVFPSLHQPDQHTYIPPNLHLWTVFCILLGFLNLWKIHALHSSESHEPLIHLHRMASPKTRILNISAMETSNLACCYPCPTCQ